MGETFPPHCGIRLFKKTPNKEILIFLISSNPPISPSKKNCSFFIPILLFFFNQKLLLPFILRVNSTFWSFRSFTHARRAKFGVRNEKSVLRPGPSDLHLTRASSAPGPRPGFPYCHLSKVSCMIVVLVVYLSWIWKQGFGISGFVYERCV